MWSNQRQGRLKGLINVGVPILGIIIALYTLGSGIWGIFDKPVLTYEHSCHPLPTGQSMMCIIIRNEGWAAAEGVEVKVTVDGEIENVSVLQRDIAGEISEFELFGKSVGIDVKDSSSIITIPYITERMKYIADLIIKPQDSIVINTLIVHSKNGGLAGKYVEKGNLALARLAQGFAAGIILAVASVFLRKSLRQYRQKGQEGPRENLKQRGEH